MECYNSEEGFSSVIAAAALVVVYANARVNVRNKQADLLAGFNKQFDELQKKRTELLVALTDTSSSWPPKRLDIESRLFFDRFWSLQYDQFLAWFEGHVQTAVFVNCASSRRHELQQPTEGASDADWTLSGRTMASSFEDIQKRWATSRAAQTSKATHVEKFFLLMQELKDSNNKSAVGTIIHTHGPGWIKRWRRKIFGGYG